MLNWKKQNKTGSRWSYTRVNVSHLRTIFESLKNAKVKAISLFKTSFKDFAKKVKKVLRVFQKGKEHNETLNKNFKL
jgi:hypothetical protein